MKGFGKGWLVGLVAIVGTLLLIGAACDGWHGGGSDPSKETPAFGVTEVRLEDFGFAPANIVIDAGTTVTWTNYDSVDHTVTSDEGDVLDSERFGEDGTFRHTFDTPGEYYYHCEPHSNMHGLVTVRPLP
ncbi:MAG: cupredoxin domain-containing protein [Chloroflexi bacterium]|nr:cupredoxin domain-containing protein [Chloroflexota bacterium]